MKKTLEDFSDESMSLIDGISINIPEKLLESSNELPELPDLEDEECEFCGGTGEITTMERVYSGEPHMADIGTRPCVCQNKEEEYD